MFKYVFLSFCLNFLPGKISLLAHLFVCLLLMCFNIVTQIQQNVCPLENCRHGASDFRRFIEIVCFDQVYSLYQYACVFRYRFGVNFNVSLILFFRSTPSIFQETAKIQLVIAKKKATKRRYKVVFKFLKVSDEIVMNQLFN